MGRIRKYKWLLIVLTLSVAFGGVAYAGYNVAVIASSPSDQWHACVSNTGLVRAPTIRLNSYPASCPRSTDTVRSWNASGPSGVNGIDGTDGQDGATGPSGVNGSDGPQGATGVTGATGVSLSGESTGYSTFVGVYSVTFSNAGCDISSVRLRLITHSGPTPAQELGPCTSMAGLGGSPPQLSGSQTTGFVTVTPAFSWRTMFGFDGYTTPIRIATPYWGTSFAVTAQPAQIVGEFPDGTAPISSCQNGSWCMQPGWGLRLNDALKDFPAGFFYPFLLMNAAASTTLPDMSTLQPPPQDLLPRFAAYSVP